MMSKFKLNNVIDAFEKCKLGGNCKKCAAHEFCLYKKIPNDLTCAILKKVLGV